MEKYLVFRLEKITGNEVAYSVPCFELVKEFDIRDGGFGYPRAPEEWARDYSSDHKVRTLVIKGSVFGGG